MPGRLWLSILNATLSSFPLAAPVLTTTAVCALETISGRIRWSPFMPRPEKSLGVFSLSTIICGITTRPLRRFSQPCRITANNKTGFVYVLNRDTGTPVFPVEERPVPQSDLPGEVTSPTQPIPVAPPPLTPQKLSPDDAWGLTPSDRETCRKWLAGMRSNGIFTPPALNDVVASPGVIGGANWSGYAFDPQRNLLFVNTNNFPFRVRLIPSEKFMEEAMKGGGEFGSQRGAPYGMFRAPFFSPSFVPCSPPPWGTLTAVDMVEGKIRWQVPLGSMQNFGVAHTARVPPGSPSLGGPIVTAGGLVFIAGTLDPIIRAFDVETGKELWKVQLPTNGHAVPITYQLNAKGKQYVVIAAGSHAKIKEEKLGDALVAFTLP